MPEESNDVVTNLLTIGAMTGHTDMKDTIVTLRCSQDELHW